VQTVNRIVGSQLLPPWVEGELRDVLFEAKLSDGDNVPFPDFSVIGTPSASRICLRVLPETRKLERLMNDETRRAFDHEDEMIDEAGRESFPASDPPAFSSGVDDVRPSGPGEKIASEDPGDAAGQEICRSGKQEDKRTR